MACCVASHARAPSSGRGRGCARGGDGVAGYSSRCQTTVGNGLFRRAGIRGGDCGDTGAGTNGHSRVGGTIGATPGAIARLIVTEVADVALQAASARSFLFRHTRVISGCR